MLSCSGDAPALQGLNAHLGLEDRNAFYLTDPPLCHQKC